MKKIKTFFYFTLVFFILSSVVFDLALAKKKESKDTNKGPADLKLRTDTSFGIYPPILDLDCRAGERVNAMIKIDNPNKEASGYKIIPQGSVFDGVNGFSSRAISSLPPNHLSRHTTLESKYVTVPGKSFKNLGLFIDVPKDLAGTQYTLFSVANVSPSLSLNPDKITEEKYVTEVGVGMQPALTVTVKCHIQDTLKYAMGLKEIKILPTVGNQPLAVDAIFINTGNAELKVYPSLILLEKNSGKIATRFKTNRLVSIVPGGYEKVSFQSASFKDINKGSYRAVFSAQGEFGSNVNLPPIEKSVELK